jgi:hypothetical protein
MWVMRIHVYLDDDLVGELDRRVGERGRSAYIEDAVRQRIDRETRWDLIWSSVGAIDDRGHPWDPDPASYFGDERRRATLERGSP